MAQVQTLPAETIPALDEELETGEPIRLTGGKWVSTFPVIELGHLSEKYESSGRGPGTVSTGEARMRCGSLAATPTRTVPTSTASTTPGAAVISRRSPPGR